MRRLVIAMMAAAALAAPMAAAGTSAPTEAEPMPAAARTTTVDQADGPRAPPHAPDLPEEATLVLIGTLLIGFAAAVRRA